MRYFLFLSLFSFFSVSAYASSFPVTITDVAGRVVTFNHPVKYIAMDDGRDFPLLEILYQKNAAKHLIAWRDDMKIFAPSMYSEYLKYYPRLANTPLIGKISKGGFNLEQFILMKPKPNLLLMDLADEHVAKQEGIIKALNQDGIKVITIDFKENMVKDTTRSILTVAKAVGREKQGLAFVHYYDNEVNHIENVINKLPKSQLNQSVFIERAAGFGGCCRTFGNDNMGQYLTLLKAHNIAILPLHDLNSGQLSPETVIINQPKIYIMQTAGWVNKSGQALGGIPLGYLPNISAIKKANQLLMSRSWLNGIPAYQNQRMYSIYQPLYNSPYNLVALEFFAKWLYPNAFKTLHPDENYSKMNERFGKHKITGLFGIKNSTYL